MPLSKQHLMHPIATPPAAQFYPPKLNTHDSRIYMIQQADKKFNVPVYLNVNNMGGACILVFSTLLLGYQSLVLAAVPPFPLEDIVKNATRALSSALNPDPIGFSSSTYLETISGIVNYFSAYQNANGSIIDPYEHRETL